MDTCLSDGFNFTMSTKGRWAGSRWVFAAALSFEGFALLHVNDRITCRITQTGEWGAYGLTPNNETVFINFGQLSWERIRNTADVVVPGDKVEVAIMREPLPDHRVFLASIKRTQSRPEIPAEGSTHDATVYRIGNDVVFAKLESGSIVGIHSTVPTRFAVGDRLRVLVVSVSSDGVVVMAEVCDTQNPGEHP